LFGLTTRLSGLVRRPQAPSRDVRPLNASVRRRNMRGRVTEVALNIAPFFSGVGAA